MLVTARITRADLEAALNDATPVRVGLGSGPEAEGRYAFVGKPTRVELVPDVGLRVTASGAIRWPVLGLETEVTLRSFTVLLSPQVVQVDGRAAIAFEIKLEEADVVALPAFVEKPIVHRVNEALESVRGKLVWKAMNTLDFHFGLGPVSPPMRGEIAATGAAVVIDAEALTLTVPWRFTVTKAEMAHA